MEKDVKFENFFLMGLPEREKVEEWLELTCAETEAQEQFLGRVADALEVIDYDYYIATLEPSFHIDEIVLVVEPHRTLDPPVVVLEVRVIEVHAPSLSRRRETSQEKHLGVRWQERLQWMVLECH